MEPRKGDALVVVDVQNDFAHPDGSLYVPGAVEVIPTIVEWIEKFKKKRLPVIFTMDWHPNDHISFDTWPKHCVQSTWGVSLHQAIRDLHIELDIVTKGEDVDKDEYSGFAIGPAGYASSLVHKLVSRDTKRIFVVGLATDYCVKATVLDGLGGGFKVIVVSDAIAGVNINPEDVALAIKEMEDAGAVMLR